MTRPGVRWSLDNLHEVNGMAGSGAASALETAGLLLRLWQNRPHILPEETRRHLQAGVRENLLAVRTVVDSAIQHEEERRRARARRSRAGQPDGRCEPAAAS